MKFALLKEVGDVGDVWIHHVMGFKAFQRPILVIFYTCYSSNVESKVDDAVSSDVALFNRLQLELECRW